MVKKPLSYDKFKEIYSTVPRLCVEVIVKTDEGIILTLRDIEPYKGLWHIPGGTVFFGETLHGAAKRIAKEELGIEIKVGKLLGYIEYPDEHIYRGFGWPIGIAFLVHLAGGTLRGGEQGKDVKAFKVIPQDTIPDQKMFLKKYKLTG